MFHTALLRVTYCTKRKVSQELCRLLVCTSPSERDRKIYYCKPGSKDRVTNHCMYTNQPRPKDRAYNLKKKTSRIKLEGTQVFSIVDTDFDTKTDNHND